MKRLDTAQPVFEICLIARKDRVDEPAICEFLAYCRNLDTLLL